MIYSCDPTLFSGRQVLCLDDMRATGSTAGQVERSLAAVGVTMEALYLAELPEGACATCEKELDHGAVATLSDLVQAFQRTDYVPVGRVMRRLLSSKQPAQWRDVVEALPPAVVEAMYLEAVMAGLERLPRFDDLMSIHRRRASR
jgi:hypothetical protein